MKISARSILCTVVFMLVAAPVFAQNSGPSATGSFEFSSGGHPLVISFDARTKTNGSTTGQVVLTGSAAIPDQDVDGEGSSGGTSIVTVALNIAVDCLKVSGKAAAMSGEITDSNIPAYIGHRALLAVVDNGEGVKAPALDQFMWGIYGTPNLTWVPSDAELTFDPGVGLTWLATDFERNDDVGIPSHPSTTVDCQTFSTEAYSFQDLPHGGGNIQVRP
ncbi:MAG TPA: hypothetical protein VF432_05095 [Thermoanaerobaculia bacterium]